MKIFIKDYQPQVSKQYQIDFSDISLQEVKVPNYNEYIGTIYMFVNNTNGKVYIGQTMTKFYSRFCSHKGDAFRVQDKLPFHNALRKYGWDSFSKYIIWQDDKVYECTPENKKLIKETLDIKEQEYILKYSSNNPNFGYNATPGGSIFPEQARSKEAVEKMRKSKKTNNYMLGKTYDKHHLAKHILQFSLNGKFIKDWSCLKLAEDTLSISINPKFITSGNYIWVYKEEDVQNKLKLLSKLSGRPGVPRPVYCFDLFGELVRSYNNATEASILTGIPQAQITHSARLKENGNVVRDYIWIYEEDLCIKEKIITKVRDSSRIYKSRYRPIYQIYLNGEIIKLWDNFESIIKECQQGRVSINKCLNGKLNVYCNCFWIYEDEYNDELLLSKLENYKRTKKQLVEDIQSGIIKYEGLKILHDTNDNKKYLKEHPVIYQYDKNYNLIKIWKNYKNIKESGLNFDNISKCLRRKLKTAFGYIWRYEEDVLNGNIK